MTLRKEKKKKTKVIHSYPETSSLILKQPVVSDSDLQSKSTFMVLHGQHAVEKSLIGQLYKEIIYMYFDTAS